MPAAARLIVMMEPADKKKLVAAARACKISVAQLARERLVAPLNPDERVFLDAVVDLGKQARRIFAEVDASEAREAAAHAAQPARDVALVARVEAAFAAARARRDREATDAACGRATERP